MTGLLPAPALPANFTAEVVKLSLQKTPSAPDNTVLVSCKDPASTASVFPSPTESSWKLSPCRYLFSPESAGLTHNLIYQKSLCAVISRSNIGSSNRYSFDPHFTPPKFHTWGDCLKCLGAATDLSSPADRKAGEVVIEEVGSWVRLLAWNPWFCYLAACNGGDH